MEQQNCFESNRKSDFPVFESLYQEFDNCFNFDQLLAFSFDMGSVFVHIF